MQLSWFKGASWCSLDDVDPRLIDGYGVFVIWRNGDAANVSTVLYVGRGQLAQEIARRRQDRLFQAGDLKITWAVVSDLRLIDGVAAYLYQRLRPMWGEVEPWSEPMPVNLPAA